MYSAEWVCCVCVAAIMADILTKHILLFVGRAHTPSRKHKKLSEKPQENRRIEVGGSEIGYDLEGKGKVWMMEVVPVTEHKTPQSLPASSLRAEGEAV